MSRLLPVTLLLLGGAAQAAPEPVPLYREIKDWVVACDNLRSCQAISAAAFGFSPLRLVIGRDAGPRAQPWVRLTYSGQPGHFTLSTDDRPLPDALASLLRTGAGEGEPILHGEGDMARALLAEWRDGEILRLDAEGEEAELSLAGLSAALLLMDSVQGRLDTRGALYRLGERDDREVPEAPPLPLLRPFPGVTPLTDAERQGIPLAVMEATRSEWLEADPESLEPEAEAHALNGQEALVLIQTSCAAYNCSFALYRVARQAPYPRQPLRIEPLPFGGEGLGGWVNYDEGSGELGYFMKGRGVGDCGDAGSWLFDGERFQLQSARMMQRCAGSPPDDWPELWRAARP
ncbi:DUF1176 domain-containing protein [Azotobacter vinelandii]|nr:DUF1176 domain-containing protein [Azotobacter vinelandii]WKN23752.1 DUF1176 domain-containing protein [Azotobacter vinelandii]GLK61901.1 hypothetical protein GCM10017624_40650 [Azotobacter vinelandii]SFX91225.1 Protein of unknown function [Azotobacter vinelandii]